MNYSFLFQSAQLEILKEVFKKKSPLIDILKTTPEG